MDFLNKISASPTIGKSLFVSPTLTRWAAFLWENRVGIRRKLDSCDDNRESCDDNRRSCDDKHKSCENPDLEQNGHIE